MTLKSKSKKTVEVKGPARTAGAPRQTKTRKASARPTRAAAKAVAGPVAPRATDPRSITVRYFAPEASSVLVAGDFTRWQEAPIHLVKATDGVWKTTLALKPGRYQYRLLVDGQWQNDPACAELQPNEFGSSNCVLSCA